MKALKFEWPRIRHQFSDKISPSRFSKPYTWTNGGFASYSESQAGRLASASLKWWSAGRRHSWTSLVSFDIGLPSNWKTDR